MAFGYQVLLGELPCPLCPLHRAAFAASGIGFALGIRFGPRPSHHGIAIPGAVAGAAIAVRQIALHVGPGTGGYRATLFGLRFCTLALIAFVALIGAVAVLLLIADSVRPAPLAGQRGGISGTACLLLFRGIILANEVSTTAECGTGPCPDDPTRYGATDPWLKRSAGFAKVAAGFAIQPAA